ncbi:FecR domain-containing protein [Calycomorphotria hydatis]|uniref:FecR protein n=1 Tax=Calycomorphotria hydatis TaxID=2528027 RepID=A0A517TBK5_9PLAN|nr:FecR domain-containing protein [Calycomorphotria hydatis]QDT65749.1 FecR protein [Calycomorphotria hydatis]
MSKQSGIRGELLTLADAMLNGVADQSMARRLSELLREDLMYRQWYIEYVDLRAAVLEHSERRTEAVCVKELLMEASGRIQNTGRNRHRVAYLFAASAALMLMLVIGATFAMLDFAPAKAGKLVGLTADAKWAGREYVPGDLVLERMTVTLEAGIATFELNDGALVSIQGPATIEATSGEETQLISGLLHAIVPKQAIGYTVHTVDAEVIDLGTEFTVERNNEFGTRVAVMQGKVDARLIEGAGLDSSFELTAGRAMKFQTGTGLAKELADTFDWSKQFDEFKNVSGGIAKLEGVVRTTPSLPADLRPGQMPTNNYIMLAKECEGIELTEDLVLQQDGTPLTLKAGTIVDSYLLHFDPQNGSTASPIGNVTFNRPILAVIASADDLQLTDRLCSATSPLFTSEKFRGLEFDSDEIHISPDQKSLSFHFTWTYPQSMDQCRVFLPSMK